MATPGCTYHNPALPVVPPRFFLRTTRMIKMSQAFITQFTQVQRNLENTSGMPRRIVCVQYNHTSLNHSRPTGLPALPWLKQLVYIFTSWLSGSLPVWSAWPVFWYLADFIPCSISKQGWCWRWLLQGSQSCTHVWWCSPCATGKGSNPPRAH